MKSLNKYSFVFFLILIQHFGKSQNVDSVLAIIHKTNSDSVKIVNYLFLSESCEFNDIPKYTYPVIELCKKNLSSKSKIDKGYVFYTITLAQAINNFGILAQKNGKIKYAIELYKSCLSLHSQTKNNEGIGYCLSNIASVYNIQGNIPMAIEYYHKSLKIRDSLKDYRGKSYCLHNLAQIYESQEEIDKALDYNLQSLYLSNQVNDNFIRSFTLNNIGNLYIIKNKYDKALDYLNRSLKISIESKNQTAMAYAYLSLGKLHKKQGKFREAHEYLNKSYDLNLKLKDIAGQASAQLSISELYYLQGEYKKAKEFAESAYKINQNIGYATKIKDACELLHKINFKLNNYKDSYTYLNTYHKLYDSLKNEENHKISLQNSIKYEYESKAIIEKAKTNQEKLILENRSKIEKLIIIGLIIIIIICIVLGAIILNRFKLTSKQNRIIEYQKKQVEEQKNIAEQKVLEIENQKKLALTYIEELKQTQEELIAAKLSLDKANNAKGEFLANISHEVRTPLNAILGFAELLKNKPANNDRYINNILTAGKNLLSLINDILDLSKIEAGQMSIHNKEFDLEEMLSEFQQMYISIAKNKGLEFKTIFQNNCGTAIITSDDVRIRQILYNLVGNAIKFTDKGQVELIVKLNKSDANAAELILTIKDTGLGIAADQKEVIFDAFKQQNGQSARKYGGTGLGLAITKKLVDLLNGTIKVDSIQNAGSTFTVHIPNIQTNHTLHEKVIKTEDLIENFENKTLLIADDIDANIEIVKAFLNVTKIKIISASNGFEAIDKIKEYNPDIILMDIMMPELDGINTVIKLKEQLPEYNKPIIAFTAAFETSKLHLGTLFKDVLLKPLDKNELLIKLKKYIKT